MAAMLVGVAPQQSNALVIGAKKKAHGPALIYGTSRGFGGPRISFTARSGRTITRETVTGSDHERRLLRRKNARKIGA